MFLAVAQGHEAPRPGHIESRQASPLGQENEHRLVRVGQAGSVGQFSNRLDLSPQKVVAGEGNGKHGLVRRGRQRLRRTGVWPIPRQSNRQQHPEQLSHGILLFEVDFS